MLLRHRWSTLSIAATLALGIGATTAIYAVFNQLLFRPTPGVLDERQLITASFEPEGRTARAYGSPAALPAMRAAASTAGLEGLANSCCSSPLAVAVPAGSPPALEQGDFVTRHFFSVLGVRARIGRLPTDDEAESGSDNVVVISERLWRTKLGGKPDALGQTIDVNGHPFQIIGVTDRFRGWRRRGTSQRGETDLWLPTGSQGAVTGQTSSMNFAIGRVRVGSSLSVIEQQLQGAYAEVARTLPPRDRGFIPFVDPAGASAFASDPEALRLYWLLMSAVTLLLVLSCANAANLLLARAGRRERDTAVRLAIGAGRWRVVRQLLVESLGLATLAGGLGLVTAVLLTTALRGLRVVAILPAVQGVEIDARVLSFCLLVTLATLLVFGLMPAMIASRVNLRGILGRSGHSVASSHRVQRGLVILQIALSLTLVAGAGVLNRSLQNLFAASLGMDLDHVIELSLKPDELGYDRSRSARVLAETMDGLRRAGFRDVALSYPNPLDENLSVFNVKTAQMARPERRVFRISSVSPDFFQVLRIPLLSGRGLRDAEYNEREWVNPMPVVVNAAFAQQLFGSQVSVGQTFDIERYIGMAMLPTTAVVVGVVGDTRSSGVRGAAQPALFHGRRSEWRYGTILVRSDAAGVAMERIRSVVFKVDPMLPVTLLRSLRDEIAEELSTDRALARLSALVALLAALLASTGVASVISQLVTERTRDFGIRTALGASQRDIIRHVLQGVLTQSLLGISLGVCVYWIISRWLEARLFGLGPLDPLIMATTVTALLATALVSASLPARRASRIDPVFALRSE